LSLDIFRENDKLLNDFDLIDIFLLKDQKSYLDLNLRFYKFSNGVNMIYRGFVN